jgi:hypothetical protein
MVEAREALSVVILESMVDILPAKEDDSVVEVSLISDTLADNEELLVFIELCKLSIFVAVDELFVVNVLFRFTILELKDAEVDVNDEFNVVIKVAVEELTVVKAPRTSVIDAAKEALSKEPVPAWAAEIVSNLPANDEEKFVEVVLIVVIDDASDALFVLIALLKLFNDVAVEELFVVIVVFIFVIEEFKEADVVVNEEFNEVISIATEELSVVIVPCVVVIELAKEALLFTT